MPLDIFLQSKEPAQNHQRTQTTITARLPKMAIASSLVIADKQVKKMTKDHPQENLLKDK